MPHAAPPVRSPPRKLQAGACAAAAADTLERLDRFADERRADLANAVAARLHRGLRLERHPADLLPRRGRGATAGAAGDTTGRRPDRIEHRTAATRARSLRRPSAWPRPSPRPVPASVLRRVRGRGRRPPSQRMREFSRSARRRTSSAPRPVSASRLCLDELLHPAYRRAATRLDHDAHQRPRTAVACLGGPPDRELFELMSQDPRPGALLQPANVGGLPSRSIAPAGVWKGARPPRAACLITEHGRAALRATRCELYISNHRPLPGCAPVRRRHSAQSASTR